LAISRSQMLEIPGSMNRIGPCADIHSAFNDVLTMHEQRPDIEHWFCAGDVVDMHKTPHYNEPVLRILSRLDIPSVMGNHDYRFKERHLHRLGEETRAYLEELPFSLDVRFAGNRIRIYHATPESREDFALERAGKKTFRALFGQENADIIVIGHTHEPYV